MAKAEGEGLPSVEPERSPLRVSGRKGADRPSRRDRSEAEPESTRPAERGTPKVRVQLKSYGDVVREKSERANPWPLLPHLAGPIEQLASVMLEAPASLRLNRRRHGNECPPAEQAESRQGRGVQYSSGRSTHVEERSASVMTQNLVPLAAW
jgi:hypothetical protein